MSKNKATQLFTQAVQTIQAKINFAGLTLKKGAKVAELRVEENPGIKQEIYPLLGDKYTIGRSSKSADIVVRNPVVSQVHCSLTRDRNNPRAFIVKDENSTNGVYLNKRRVKSYTLYHGDRFTLGPPELESSPELEIYNPPPLWIKLIRYSLFGTSGVLGLIILVLGYQWSRISVSPLPSGIVGPVVIYAKDGKPLTPKIDTPHRELKQLKDFSPYLPKAVIASEDSRYNWHFGVDPYGILRAIVVNRRQGLNQGASTVTQQLARSLFSEVGRQNTVGRKLREMIVALKLEAVYSKDEILTAYLNRVYLGVSSYGFEDAAEFYFDKSARDLTLSEAATLVAILPGPNIYNPVKDYDTAIGLRNRVIERMAKLGMISDEEANRARRSRIEVSEKARKTLAKTIAPYFYSYVFDELNELLGEDVAKEGNFIVETALDPQMQKKAETALRNSVSKSGSTYNYSQGAIVTLNTSNGEILALVGGVDYAKSQFNRATTAKRQPGSTFKVFAYAAAIENNISPGKIYSCEALIWEGQRYKPCERSSGSVDMYRGIAQSENAIALRVARDVGLDKTIDMAQRLGIKSKLADNPGLVLGESEVKALEITGAYAVFANRGIWHRPHAIKRILDGGDCTDNNNPQTCREIYAFDKDNNASKRVISQGVARTMTTMLRGVIQGGTGNKAAIGLGEAGKTGTTNSGVDLWFIGYIPTRQVVTGIWLGNDDNKPTKGSSAQAASLWANYMSKAVNQGQ